MSLLGRLMTKVREKKSTSYMPWETFHERSLCIFILYWRSSPLFFFVLDFFSGFSLLLLHHPCWRRRRNKKRRMVRMFAVVSPSSQYHLSSQNFSIVLKRTIFVNTYRNGRVVSGPAANNSPPPSPPPSVAEEKETSLASKKQNTPSKKTPSGRWGCWRKGRGRTDFWLFKNLIVLRVMFPHMSPLPLALIQKKAPLLCTTGPIAHIVTKHSQQLQ